MEKEFGGIDETDAARRARAKEEARARKKRKRMPVHGAGLRKIPEIWKKRSAKKAPLK